jgi:hypothetical protein
VAFTDVETHWTIRGFNGSESVCIRAAQLAFCVLVTCRGDQVRTSITSGVVDVFVTPDLTHPIFSVLVKFSKLYRAHFGGDSSGLILIATDNVGVAPHFIPFLRGENADGATGLK